MGSDQWWDYEQTWENITKGPWNDDIEKLTQKGLTTCMGSDQWRDYEQTQKSITKGPWDNGSLVMSFYPQNTLIYYNNTVTYTV